MGEFELKLKIRNKAGMCVCACVYICTYMNVRDGYIEDGGWMDEWMDEWLNA